MSEYAVGYKRPPVHTRFKKGQSGNPKGPPKKQLNTDDVVDKVLRAKITIREGEKVRRIDGVEALFLAARKKALSGHMPSIKFLHDILMQRRARMLEETPFRDEAEYQRLIDDYLARSGRPIKKKAGKKKHSKKGTKNA